MANVYKDIVMTLINRFPLIVILSVAGIFVAPQALAVPTGQCSSDTGIKDYPFNFNAVLTIPEQNVANKVIEDAAGNSWNSKTNYKATCGCTNMTAAYATAVSGLTDIDHTDGTITYYAISEYLAVGSLVWIGGSRQELVPTPFANESNRSTASGPCSSQPYTSGARGQINLYFRRTFVGQSIIPNTKLLDIYLSSTSGVTSSTPVSSVYMSGTVTVPQSCEINPQPVNVDFGDIIANNFKTKGVKPDGFTPINKQLTVACRNIAEGVVISLSFQATPDTNEPMAFKTSNDDIGVIIEDRDGKIIAPKSGKLPVTMDYVAQSGTTEMNVYPINTTGNALAVGEFNATATIRAEIH